MLDTWREVLGAGFVLLFVVIALQAALVWMYLDTLQPPFLLFFASLIVALPAYVWLVRGYAMHPRGDNRTVIYGLMVLGLAGISLSGYAMGTIPMSAPEVAMQMVLQCHSLGLFVGAVGSSKYEREDQAVVQG
jgi:hypothetical protein